MLKKSIIALLILLSTQAYAQELDSILSPIKFRNIGPFRGGRSVAASGVPGDILTYYMGTTGGGLWKTRDAGQSWKNISDGYFKTGSVGAVAVSQSNPNVVYCGMGEHAPRGVMTSYGDGVYKSTDGGKTWLHLGLEKTQHISRIIIHPEDPEIVYVAAQGALYGPNSERGVFKSTDGGITWSKLLYVNDLTGCSELSMDVTNPSVLYAAMWEHQRKPWKVISGGQGSGLYKSSDGGKTWKKIHTGLPEEKGKMAIAVCRSNPERVYALIESDSDKEKGGLFVSENGGDSWVRISKDHRLTQRAWYYTEVFPDPVDEHTVYVLSAPALRSIDGGKTWERITGTHGDFHDLWINPDNPSNMVIANDGGAAISFDRGESWSRQDNMPTAQIYRINTDNLYPYNIYGGQQDNTSIRIASQALDGGGITQQHWSPSAGGESAFLAFDPDNPRYVMGGSYLGTIELLDTEAKASINVMPAPIQYLGREARNMKYLYNWNAPIIWSRHEPNTYYHAAQYLLRTRDMGKSWEEVSPDLTRNIDEKQGNGGGPYTNEAVGAENYGTISYVVESPHEKGVIWTGSDDGYVQLTRDGGETWENVTPKGLGETLVNAIEISPHDAGTAYIATSRYKFNDYTPAIYKTTNYGRSWTNISEGIPYGAFTRVVREDAVSEGLLFAGTETGMYISVNGGKSWEPLQLNLPITPITDLKVHGNDLVVATSGRSFWVLDDLPLVRQIVQDHEDLTLFEPAPAHLGNWYSGMNSNSSDGMDAFEGVNPPNGIVIYYTIPEGMNIYELIMEIRDENGDLIRTFSSVADSLFKSYPGGPRSEPMLSGKPGLNRFVWNMRHSSMIGVPEVYIEASYAGHKAIPGNYSIQLKSGERLLETRAIILDNPNYEIDMETYQDYDAFMSKAEDQLNEMHHLVNRLDKARRRIESIVNDLQRDKKFLELRKNGRLIAENIREWDSDMVQRKSKAYDDVENFPNKFTAELMFLINQTESSLPRVNEPNRLRYDELMEQWEPLRRRAMSLLETDIPNWNKALWDAGIGAVDSVYR